MKAQILEAREVEVKAALETDETQLALITSGTYAVANIAEFEIAGAQLATLKSDMKIITDAWAPIKKSAHETHKRITAQENASLAPYKAAEAVLRAAMDDFLARERARQRAAEAAQKEAQRIEAERMLAEAMKADERGDAAGAAASMAMAEMVEDMRSAVPAPSTATAFTTTRKTWKARVTDFAAVPIAACGVEIRPINEAALNEIARVTKGTANIPGVEFYLDETVAVRGR